MRFSMANPYRSLEESVLDDFFFSDLLLSKYEHFLSFFGALPVISNMAQEPWYVHSVYGHTGIGFGSLTRSLPIYRPSVMPTQTHRTYATASQP